MSVIIYHLSPSATFDMSCLGAPQIEGLVGFVLEELVPYRGVFACRHYQNEHIIGCGFWWTHNFLKTLPNDGKQNRTKIQVILWESWLKKVQFQIFQPQISCHDCYVHDKIIMKNRPVLPRSPHQHLWPWSRWNNPMENLQNRQASFFQHKTPINKVWHPVFFPVYSIIQSCQSAKSDTKCIISVASPGFSFSLSASEVFIYQFPVSPAPTVAGGATGAGPGDHWFLIHRFLGYFL